MSKEHSEADTKLTPSKRPERNLSVMEQTKRAMKFYKIKREDYLKEVKQQFEEQRQEERYRRTKKEEQEEILKKKRKKKKKKKEIGKKKVVEREK